MKETITIRIDANLMNKLRKDAQKDNRSMNNFIETILIKQYQKDKIENDETN